MSTLTADDVDTIMKAVAEAIIAAQPREWNSPDEAAAYMGLSHQYLAKLRMTEGAGPVFHKVSSRVLYRRADLDAWLASHRGGKSDAA